MFAGQVRVVAALAALVMPCAAAQAQVKVSAPFTNATDSNWTFTGTDAATSNPSGVLTAGKDLSGDGVGTGGTKDTAGNGWLRVTSRGNYKVGNALYTAPSGAFSSSYGVQMRFDYVAWGGTGADGISVYLYDANSNMSGALVGAGLGYCSGAGGYLGVGVDEYGSYSQRDPYGRCVAPGPNESNPEGQNFVAIRGPTNAPGGANPYVKGLAVGESISNNAATVRPSKIRRIYVDMIPKDATGSAGYRVSAYYLSDTASGDGARKMLFKDEDFAYPAPSQLRVGVGGSTGGLTNFHEIRNLVVAAPADIGVTKTVSNSTPVLGEQLVYVVKVKNQDINTVDPGDQSPAISAANAATITDTLPSGLANVTWTCTASTGSTCPATSGTGNLNVNGGYTLASGGELTFTITALVSDVAGASCGASLVNTATVAFPASSAFSDINPNNDRASASAVITCPAAFIGCPSQAFITRGTSLFSLDLLSGAITDLGASLPASSPLRSNSVNAVGFGKDGYIWGWYNGDGSQPRRLVRIGQNGVADLPYAVAPGALGSTGFYAADVDPVTGYLVLSTGSTLYRVNPATNQVIGSGVAAPMLGSSTDYAFDKAATYLYSVNNSTREVFRAAWNGSTLGAREVLTTLPASPGSSGWGAIFMDGDGNIYAYRSGAPVVGPPAQPATVGLVYRIFKTASGSWSYDLLADDAATSTNLDGARCPAAVTQLPPAVLLRKTTTGVAGGPFTFTLDNVSRANATVTTTQPGQAVQVDGDANLVGLQSFTVSTVSQNVVITESALPAGWKLEKAECRNRAGALVGTRTGGALTLPAASVVAGEVFECDFTNAQMTANLSLSKTNNRSTVVKGSSVDYIIVARNDGPDAADGAVLRDTIPATLTCNEPVTCTRSSDGGNCPVAVTASGLNAGLSIPSFPNGEAWTMKMTCTVN